MRYFRLLFLLAFFFLLFPISTVARTEYITVGGETVPIEVPEPRVNIPGLEFKSAPTVTSSADGENTLIVVPYLGQYIAAVYQYAVAVASVIAVVMIIVAGFEWIISGGSADTITKAKGRIQNAIIGLILALGSYVILSIINPELVSFRNLQVQFVQTQELQNMEDEYHLDTPYAGTVYKDTEDPIGDNIVVNGVGIVPKQFKDNIEAVARSLEKDDYGLLISSGYRSLEKQMELVRKNCTNPNDSQPCQRKAGGVLACKPIANNPGSCPHTTGAALDIWATKDGKQCIEQKNCKGSGAAGVAKVNNCFNDPCQKKLIEAMSKLGFCVLDMGGPTAKNRDKAEPWHFEKPAISGGGSCNKLP